ncbi:ABC transporter substrate-binding protein [Butyrivibrio sp. YAB3001]|uniref:ABC transporter substrate-binding protein n=1 Tax=Butyrivibrio sp. YAB3001 TaxID=1520812 RepID=UPI0008F65F5F|nr:ABC transporter substrate-binding protein [Butyrivibrio sp. YAB3001]SFC90385.1 simple sugar transport system substrate-binding protein [Butyrivibrio sp. YAB3001]
MKKNASFAMIMLLLLALFVGCGSTALKNKTNNDDGNPQEEDSIITVGFSQLGAESDWRNANTRSMQASFAADDNYALLYKNGQQKQTNQITAIRMFIQQGVDYIVLAPVTESGWDSVLGEARDAGIPVILVDRRVDVTDKNLYSCWVGSDFELEGKKMAAWIKSYTESIGMVPEDLHIVNIQGTIGSTAQIGRTRGLANAARENGWDLMEEITGDFTETKGREVMAALLKRFDNINIVYCENDNEAMGAIDAIEAAGLKAGPNIKNGDIMVVSFDGVNIEALEYAKQGKISCIAECNPMHGPRVKALIDTLVSGQTPDKFNYVDEKVFSSISRVKKIQVDGVTYDIDLLED